jgi:hypothetical protein
MTTDVNQKIRADPFDPCQSVFYSESVPIRVLFPAPLRGRSSAASLLDGVLSLNDAFVLALLRAGAVAACAGIGALRHLVHRLLQLRRD